MMIDSSRQRTKKKEEEEEEEKTHLDARMRLDNNI
jgi:hypothetical protein